MKKIIYIFLMVGIWTNSYSQKNSKLTFVKTLENHLNSIRNRDLNGLEITIADDVTLLFPDGEILKTKEKFVAFHKDWFQNTLWEMQHEVINVKESKNLSFALVKYQYKKLNEDGTVLATTNSYLLLIFEKQKNEWKLIHDQNTKIII